MILFLFVVDIYVMLKGVNINIYVLDFSVVRHDSERGGIDGFLIMINPIPSFSSPRSFCILLKNLIYKLKSKEIHNVGRGQMDIKQFSKSKNP